MMNKRCLSHAIMILSLMPLTLMAQNTATTNHSAKINKIISATSIGLQMNGTTKEFHDQFSQNPLGLNPSTNDQMMNIFKHNFDQKTLVDDAFQTFQDNYNAQYADSVINWIHSKASQQVLHTKQDYYTLQGIRKRVVNKYELEQNPPSQERTNIIDSLAHRTSAAEAEINANVKMFRAVVKAFSRLSDQRTFSDAQIEGFVNNYRSQMNSQMDQEIQKQLLVMYHSIDNQTLKTYSSFYTTEPGKWLNKTTLNSMQEAFDAATDRFLKSVEKINAEQ